MTLAVAGMTWLVSMMTRSPFFRREAGDDVLVRDARYVFRAGPRKRTFRAIVSCRFPAQWSACALPRPSANRSAEFANTR